MVSYDKLRHLLVDRDLQLTDLVIGTGITWKTAAKIKKNEYTSMQTLERICEWLGVGLNDVVEFIKK